jgi:hypothetical protein
MPLRRWFRKDDKNVQLVPEDVRAASGTESKYLLFRGRDTSVSTSIGRRSYRGAVDVFLRPNRVLHYVLDECA